MVDMLRSSQNEDQRKRDEAQFYSIQQQVDDLRRQLRENLARQQWFEELYKQSDGKISQVQLSQDRLTQDVAQALHARQIDEARMKGQLAELMTKVEAPDKQLRELRAGIVELAESRKADRDVDAAVQRQIDDLQRHIREVHARFAQATEANKQMREIVGELEAAIAEARQETVRVAELQSMEEQRLRRQGVELQTMFETLRQQFTDIAARSQRVDEVRRQLSERLDTIEGQLTPLSAVEETLRGEIERLDTQFNEQHIGQQEGIEAVRFHSEAQLGEMRQLHDQRTDRILNRFSQVEERLRVTDQILSEMPSRFEALERRDEVIGSEADTMEEWLVTRQMEALESILEDVRKRRADRAPAINPAAAKPQPRPEIPGSVYNPSGLIRSVRDAKPPTRDAEMSDED